MNHPVGKRYVERLMPLGPNSRSDGSMVGSRSIRVRHAFSVPRSHMSGRSDPVHSLLLLF